MKQTKLPDPPEREIQRAVIAFLECRGALVVRVNSGMLPRADGGMLRLNSAPGCSDLLVCYRGRFIAVEVKRPGNKPTAKQATFLGRVNSAGGISAVVRSIDDARALLDGIDTPTPTIPAFDGSYPVPGGERVAGRLAERVPGLEGGP